MTPATNRLRKTVTRGGRHRFGEAVGFISPLLWLRLRYFVRAIEALPYRPACSSRGDARSDLHSTLRGVQKHSSDHGRQGRKPRHIDPGPMQLHPRYELDS